MASYLILSGYLFGIPDSSVNKESACNSGDPSLIPGSGRSAGEEIGYPLQYSWASWWLRQQIILLQCGRPWFDPLFGKIAWRREQLPTSVFWPGEFTDRGAWKATVYRVAKSQTQLNNSYTGRNLPKQFFSDCCSNP